MSDCCDDSKWLRDQASHGLRSLAIWRKFSTNPIAVMTAFAALTESSPAADREAKDSAADFKDSIYHNYGAFDRDWYARYPGAWYARGFAAGEWTRATWPVINNWFGATWPAVAYDYGNDVTYQDNNVYLNDQPIATTADYYQSAADLAQTGMGADVPSEQPPADADPFAAPHRYLCGAT